MRCRLAIVPESFQYSAVCAELLKREVLVDWRPNAGVRMSPHFYTSDQEIETAVAAVEEILSSMAVAK